MKTNFTKLMAALALLVTLAIPMGMWGQTRDVQQLTNANIVAAGTASNGYQAWTITDGNSHTWNAYAIKNYHSGATSSYHYLQIKKYASNTAYYIQVPELGTQITSITMTVSNASKPMDGGGNTATLYFSNSNSTSSTGTGVASGSGASSVTINCSSLNLNTGYITASAGVRIWDVAVTYTTGGGGTQHTITINSMMNGTVQASAAQAAQGVTITLTPQPNANYTLGSMDVIGQGSTAYTLTDNGNGTYSFEMPNENVYVNATFLPSTTVTIDDNDLTNTDLNHGTAAGSLSATVTQNSNGNPISGATVTWASSNTNVATIASDGTVTLVATGTTDITATYAGNANYAGSSDTYQLTVTNSAYTVYTYDFTDVENFWTDNTYTTHPTASSSNTQGGYINYGSFYYDNATYDAFSASGTYYCFHTGHYFFLGQTDALLTLPTYAGYQITRVIVHNSSSCSTTVNVSVVSGANTASNGQTWGTTSSSYTYDIAAAYQTSELSLKVTNNKNAQIIGIDVVCEPINTNKVATPEIDPAGGDITEATSVTITCATTGATIYYTTDGNTPTTSSTQYTGAITVNPTNTVTIKAIAVMSGMDNSDVAEATFTRLYNITVNQPTTGGTITASPLQAAAGATITLTKSANVGYTFSAWDITPSTITVSNDAFTMPEQDVTVSATFTTATTYTVSFSINSKIEMTATVNSGTSIDLTKFEAEVTTPGNTMFKGWYDATTGGNKYTTITPQADVTLYAQFGEPEANGYTLVTSTDQLVVGNLVVITAHGETNLAMSTTQNNNNRSSTSHITKTAQPWTNIVITENTNDVCEFELRTGTTSGTWAFYDSNKNGYLYAASSSSNHLKTQSTLDDNGSWVIDIATGNDAGNATVTAQGTYTHNVLRRNGDIFSCYISGSQQPVFLYTKSASNSKATRDVSANSKVTAIAADVLVTVKSQGIVYLTGANAGNETNLVVEDGGQLFTSANVKGTMLKGVTGYGNNTAASNYYLISTPLTTNTNPMNVLHMINTAGYDLYYFDQNPSVDPETGIGNEWRNYKAGNGFNLRPGDGYLYANRESLTLEFAGTLRKSIDVTTPFSKNITCEGTQNWAGWNLIGNPYSVNATLSTCDFYEMKSDGSEIITATSSVVKPMQGIFAYTDGTVTSVTFTPGETNAKSSGIVINVTNENQLLDRAIVRFGEGGMLPKFQLNPNSTKVFFTEGNQDFAVVRSGNDGEMPVSFKAETNGTYTLSADITELEMNYLHLIDNMTGADVDLLATPSYTFDARTTDYASRFKLVFSANGTNENTMDNNTTFAYFNGSEWTVDNTGEATLQVIDVLGRLVNTQTINGNTTLSLNQTPGIYMLRLVNGNDVKVQKIVVR